MMKLKAALAAATIASMVVGGYGFIRNSKPATSITYYYKGPFAKGSPLLTEDEIKNTDNWTTTCPPRSFGAALHSITFNKEEDADGITDGEYSLQEAVDALWLEYVNVSQQNQSTYKVCFTPDVPGATAICMGRTVSNE